MHPETALASEQCPSELVSPQHHPCRRRLDQNGYYLGMVPRLAVLPRKTQPPGCMLLLLAHLVPPINDTSTDKP